MKYSFLVLAFLVASVAYAKEVKDFNKVLFETVQKDINTDNDQVLKPKRMRGPASVIENPSYNAQEENKFEKRNVRQTGSEKW